MWLIVGLLLFSLWCVVSPFLPKEGKGLPAPVIHNVIHIVNSPVYNSSAEEYPNIMKKREAPASEADIFLRDRNKNRF